MDHINPGADNPPPAGGNTNTVLSKEAFHPHLLERVKESQQTGEPLTVAIVDIDNFKSVNDTRGHDRGDQVIDSFKTVSIRTFRTHDEIAEQQERPRDVVFTPPRHSEEAEAAHLKHLTVLERMLQARVGHIGGDEFTFEIGANLEGAQVAADRLKANWEEFLAKPENADIKELDVKPSIGLASLTTEMMEMAPEEATLLLLKSADRDMYEDKIRNIPNLTRRQRIALGVSGFVLKHAGIRQRDLPKYQRVAAWQKQQQKEG